MNILDVLKLCAGLAFFLFGMNIMSKGLEMLAGGKLESALNKISSKPMLALLTGLLITTAVQSSSAITVMLVGIVNSGLMEFPQTLPVIFGANIGTTLTSWIISLSGIESENILLQLLKPENFCGAFALIGVVMYVFSKHDKRKNIGQILAGFSVLMYGMSFMSSSVSGLADSPAFIRVLSTLSNPILGIIAGTVITAVIQSSAASIAMLQALALSGLISYRMAVPIVLGQNIGTCFTGLLSSIGTGKNAKRVAVVHLLFNVIGSAIFITLFLVLSSAFNWAFIDEQASVLSIAVIHTIYNIAATAILCPFSKLLIKLTNFLVRGSADKEDEASQFAFLDERLLQTPPFALKEAEIMCMDMAILARQNVEYSIKLMTDEYSKERINKIMRTETKLDQYEDNLRKYLLRLSSTDLSSEDNGKAAKLLQAITEYERLGDYAVSIVNITTEMEEKKLSFSRSTCREIYVIIDAIKEMLELTNDAFIDFPEKANDVEPLAYAVSKLVGKVKRLHIKRLQSGEYTAEIGFYLSDILNAFKRISDHCSNIAAAVVSSEEADGDTHQYLQNRRNDDENFRTAYKAYKKKYNIENI